MYYDNDNHNQCPFNSTTTKDKTHHNMVNDNHRDAHGHRTKRPKKKQGKKNLHYAQRLVTVGEERPAQHPFNSLVTLFVNKLKTKVSALVRVLDEATTYCRWRNCALLCLSPVLPKP